MGLYVFCGLSLRGPVEPLRGFLVLCNYISHKSMLHGFSVGFVGHFYVEFRLWL